MYKIFIPSENKFSNGGIIPSLTTNGKMWGSTGVLKNHLKQEYGYPRRLTVDEYKDDDVVIEYELVEITRVPVKKWLTEHEAKRN